MLIDVINNIFVCEQHFVSDNRPHWNHMMEYSREILLSIEGSVGDKRFFMLFFVMCP